MYNGPVPLQDAIEMLDRELGDNLVYRDTLIGEQIEKIRKIISINPDFMDSANVCLAEIARNSELLIRDMREAMISFYNELGMLGLEPEKKAFEAAPGVSIEVDENCLRIVCAAMLPYPTKGSVYYVHQQLETALRTMIREERLPQPFLTERCAVVFLHHYGRTQKDLRQLRDYDNVEHRCITNVLASHLLTSDSPRCIIGMDILAPGDSNFTEIRVMPIPDFRDFIGSKIIEYSP